MKNEKMLLYKKIMVTVVSGGMLLLPNWGYALPQGGARSWAAVAVSALLAAVQWILPATAAIWL